MNQEIINKLFATFDSRIKLRALEPDDYKTSLKWRNDDDIAAMVGGHRYVVGSETERQWVLDSISGKNRIVFAICTYDNEKYIGNIVIKDIDLINRTARVHVMIGDKDEWGKGYATEAKFLGLKFVFEERGVNRVGAYIKDDNIASIKLHKKCGFKEEGLLRKSIYKNGVSHNQVVMGCLREDYEEAFIEYLRSHQLKGEKLQ